MEWGGTLVVLATPPMSGALWDDSRKRVEREVKWFAVIIPDPDHDPVSRAKVISVDAERVAEDFSVVARVGLFEQVRWRHLPFRPRHAVHVRDLRGVLRGE